jgi:hypothetical protein
MTTSVELALYEVNEAGKPLEATHNSIATVNISEYSADLLQPFTVVREGIESNGKDTYTFDEILNTNNNLKKRINEEIEHQTANYQSSDREEKDNIETILFELISLKRLLTKSLSDTEADTTPIISFI